MIAMAGMLFAGNDFVAFGSSRCMVVAVAVDGIVTVLPALLWKLGEYRADPGPAPSSTPQSQ